MALAALRDGSVADLTIAKNHQADTGIELLRDRDAFAVMGQIFDFCTWELYNADKPAGVREVGIYELSETAFVDEFELVHRVASTYFQAGTLSRHVSWNFTIPLSNGQVIRDAILNAGRDVSIQSFVHEIEQGHSAS